MKIYFAAHEFLADETDESFIPMLLSHLPEELRDTVAKTFRSYLSLLPLYHDCQIEKARYQIMWTLRKLDEKIELEGGQIVVSETGGIDLKGFSSGLKDEIRDALSKSL